MSHQPITDAVYPKGAAHRRKPKPTGRKPSSPRSTIAGALGAKAIDELYRQLGFKRPEQRKGGKR